MAACGKVEDPSLYPAFDAATAEPPPVRSASPASATANVYWGDLHVHTSLSYDAYTMGVRALPDDAYRYMKGGTIEHGMGYAIRAVRPLDFGAVTDHSEFMGVARHISADKEPHNTLRDVMESGNPLRITWHFLRTIALQMGSSQTRSDNFGVDGMDAVSKNAWRNAVETANRHNQPGVFTALVGYEWTSMPNEDNLHRNVIYRDSNVTELPYSSLNSDDPQDLWDELDRQRSQGKRVFAIPHNGNVSNGRMYQDVDFTGGALDANYAAQRMRNEPISEIIQVKGNSETHPELSPEDEFADFEIYDQKLSADGSLSKAKGSYARDALRTGIELAHNEGFNPYKFGVIGSSDSHNASHSVEENNFHGKLPMLDGSAGLRLGKTTLLPKKQNRGGRWSAQGLAAVWAQENTREALFDAMRRRETYATSGTRISVRFFAGWHYPDDLLQADDLLDIAYRDGVPMGSELSNAKLERSPVFAVWAQKDPIGANLDRIQIIKAWVDAHGASHEQVYDVAASGARKADAASGKLPPVGNTVDAANATYTNSIGEAQLATLWRDPQFEPQLEAFYYARVIEIPTPRFTTFDAKTMAVKAQAPVSLQERAITSAIWYQP